MQHEPTIGEVYRLLVAMDKRLEGLVSQAVFKAEQDFSRQQFGVLSADLSDWKAESRGEHARLDGRLNTMEKDLEGQIKAERERADTLERSARDARSRTWLSIAIAASGAVVSIGIAVFNNVMGG